MTVLRHFTFGTDHNPVHAHLLQTPRASEGYVTIEAPNPHVARAIMFAIFGAQFAFDYGHDEFIESNKQTGYYPAGCLLLIPWLDEMALTNAAAQIDYTYELADGDSNDAEIVGLQMARDILAEIIHHQPEEAS